MRNDVNIATQEGATSALSTIDDALSKVTSRASEFGAVSNRISSTVDALQTSYVNARETQSRIEDADMAKEITEISAAQVREKAQIAMQAQANSQRSSVLRLLQ